MLDLIFAAIANAAPLLAAVLLVACVLVIAALARDTFGGGVR